MPLLLQSDRFGILLAVKNKKTHNGHFLAFIAKARTFMKDFLKHLRQLNLIIDKGFPVSFGNRYGGAHC